jgi:hypothetical protein
MLIALEFISSWLVPGYLRPFGSGADEKRFEQLHIICLVRGGRDCKTIIIRLQSCKCKFLQYISASFILDKALTSLMT